MVFSRANYYMWISGGDMQNEKITIKKIKEMQGKKIQALYSLGFSMAKICELVQCSKTTVFFALNRSHQTGGRARGVKKKLKIINN